MRLYVNEGSNRGDHRIYDPGERRRVVEVQTVALDERLAAVPSVDLVKMDIQGAEPAALRGMEALLRRSPAAIVLTEFWPFGMERFGVGAEAYVELLAELGFRLHVVDEREGVIRATDPARLLALYPPDVDAFTNLLCTR